MDTQVAIMRLTGAANGNINIAKSYILARELSLAKGDYKTAFKTYEKPKTPEKA